MIVLEERPDALDVVPATDPAIQRQNWTLLCDRIEWLSYYRGSNQFADKPDTKDRPACFVFELRDLVARRAGGTS